MLLVNEVALGQCLDLNKYNRTLDHAPDGYSSVHGVANSVNKSSDFTVRFTDVVYPSDFILAPQVLWYYVSIMANKVGRELSKLFK